MEKNISTHTKGISKEDKKKWIEAITQGTVEGKEIDETTSKQLHRIGSRSVSLEEATVIARVINESSEQVTATAFDNAFNALDLVMIVLQDSLGVTEEQIAEAQSKIKEKRESYLEEKQEEVRKQQEQAKEKEPETDSSEKVVQMNPNDK